jgi:hypothetical protein
MGEVDDDLRATSDSINADLDRLKHIEQVKRGLRAADPEADVLSAEAESIAARVHRQATAERELVEEAGGS